MKKKFSQFYKYSIDNKFINKYDFEFKYKKLNQKEESQFINNYLNFYIYDQVNILDKKKRTLIWNKAWDTSIKTNSAIPSIFIRKSDTYYIDSYAVKSNTLNLESRFYDFHRTYLFYKYFYKYKNIYEFGCGKGLNLIFFNQFQNKNYFGFEKSTSAIKHFNNYKSKKKIKNINLNYFDFYKRKYKKLEESCAVYTQGALEQISQNDVEKFIKDLILMKPDLCVHSEPSPLVTNHRKTNIDLLQTIFLKKRNMNIELSLILKDLHKRGKIKLLDILPVYFGSVRFCGYSLFIWKPI